MKRRKSKSIHGQIFSGYMLVILLTSCIVLLSIAFLVLINVENKNLERERTNQASTQMAIAAHYEWLDHLSMSIQTNTEFDGSLDGSTCSLGSWLAGVTERDLHNPKIKAAVDALQQPHNQIHAQAAPLLQQAKRYRNGAYQTYVKEVQPRAAEVIDQLTIVSMQYKEMGDKVAVALQRLILFSIVCSVILAVIMVFIAAAIAKKIAHRISSPIKAVAEWSEQLSMGAEELDFESAGISQDEDNEVGVMLRSFKKMAESVQDNVSVIRRVADGDMTAFVNIRSSKDSLGKNLYRMVQSNDLLFNEIVQVAQAVANDSSQIANASHTLAESATAQADAVQRLSDTVEHAGQLIRKSTEETHRATDISEQIKQDAHDSTEEMEHLVKSVDSIREASEKISSVIKSIDDIAFQTNLLALNAAIEAARAGEAGKGFAVVANQVRDLALRSANAAQESKTLIESTIERVHEGSKISVQTSERFSGIIEEVNRIVDIITEIYRASTEQLEGIDQVNTAIKEIMDAATTNASTSEESAAASAEMSNNAALLKEAMKKFNLRKRQRGQAYIPPEKQNDPEFIKRANENYMRALKTGRYGYEYLETGEPSMAAGQLPS